MSDISGRRSGLADGNLISLPLLLATFASTLFLSALLLFAVQPMFARIVLPVLGGSPAVWSVAMCFFQVALLAGYAYAHLLSKWVRTPIAVIIHLGILFAAMIYLPLGIATGWTEPPGDGLHLWTFGLFAASIGLPFFALAGNAPLLQAWFARTGHKHAKDPYFLYGSSNCGSLLALLAYPFLIEPSMTLVQQGAIWSLGYKVLTIAVGVCGLGMLLARTKKQGIANEEQDGLSSEPLTWRMRMTWMGLAFVPSGLLVAVTSHITTDIAAAPFLWVLPLALFLLTFVITFQRRPILPHKAMLAIQPAVIALLVISMQVSFGLSLLAFVAIQLGAFFVNAMVCHGELVRRRPSTRDLTSFYLWMSVGGALGGLFAGLIAPNIFPTVIEYPIMIFLALLARPGLFSSRYADWMREGGIAVAIGMLILLPKVIGVIDWKADMPILYFLALIGIGVAIALSRSNPLRLAGLVAVTLIAGHTLVSASHSTANYRGFFGVNKVIETADGKFRLLAHGTTIHGAQVLGGKDTDKPEPLTYFHTTGPFADIIRAKQAAAPMKNIGVVGLGAGSLACYRKPQETWKFFEIDPVVIRLATDPEKFRFLSRCAPQAKIVLGDARLTIAKEPDRKFDLLIVDAFSSDAIPVHLLTREAIQVYLSKLSDNGVLALHISNRNMELRPVVAAVVRELNLVAFSRLGGAVGNMKETYKSSASLVAIARNRDSLGALQLTAGWSPLQDKGWRVWTDDYSNVLGAILAKLAETDAGKPRSASKN